MAIKIYCDVCKKECLDINFVCEMTKAEEVVTISGNEKEFMPRKRLDKQMIQICKGCYYTHISKLIN